MKPKKYLKAKLKRHSSFFFLLGLALTLVIVYLSHEWKTTDRYLGKFQDGVIQVEESVDIPITQRIIEVVPPPPPPPAPEKIEIIADEEDIIETVLETTEVDEGDAVEIEYEEIEEVIEEEIIEEDIPFAIIETVPVFPGCKGSNEKKRACMTKAIHKHVIKKYNVGLAAELGLTPGKKRVSIQFVIDKTGVITDIKARAPHARLEKEAIKVIQSLPTMTPGKQRGKAVGVRYTLPITLVVLE